MREGNHADFAIGRVARSLPFVTNSYCACRGSGMPLSRHSESDGCFRPRASAAAFCVPKNLIRSA